jgi:nucleoside diphosphate kinase
MSKKHQNLRMIEEYLKDEFSGQEIRPKEVKGLVEERAEQLFYTFEVGDQYFLALVRALVEEETVFPVLEGKEIAEKMRSNPNAYVVVDKGPTGKGTEVKIR